MKTCLLRYELPTDLVATHPLPERDGGRLLVLDRDRVTHRKLADLPDLLPAGALLVVNDSRVLRARLIGTRSSGGRAELLLLRRVDGSTTRWTALGRPARRLRPGSRIQLGELGAEVLERLPTGELVIDLTSSDPIDQALERFGRVPIPPYLGRQDEPIDAERYQTVYAERPGSVAAPTAGLHLTLALLAKLRERGVEIGRVTLHVGPGTFQPVTADDLDEHRMHAEWLQVSDDVVGAVERARARGAPVIAVGTTVVRALESAKDPARPGRVVPTSGDTRLLVQPGYRFSVVDGLLTNFHLPRSTLLALVAAFAGLEPLLGAYREAVAQGYRFLSYGDAMLIPQRSTPS